METIQQIRRAHKKSESAVSLRMFAKQNNVLNIVTQAHEAANQTRGADKADRTKAMTRATREKNRKSGGKQDVTVLASKR